MEHHNTNHARRDNPSHKGKAYTWQQLVRIIFGSLLIVKACLFAKDIILLTILLAPTVFYASNTQGVSSFMFIVLKILFFALAIIALICVKYLIYKGIKWIFYRFEWKDLLKVIVVGIMYPLLVMSQFFLLGYLAPSEAEALAEKYGLKKEVVVIQEEQIIE